MDYHLRQLQRAAQATDDVETLRRYIAALERLIGGMEETPSRSGWTCPDPERLEYYDSPSQYEYLVELVSRPNGGRSPDGICAYFSEEMEDGNRAVELVIDGQRVMWRLPEDYDPEGETDDACIFCGDPEERK